MLKKLKKFSTLPRKFLTPEKTLTTMKKKIECN